MLVRLLARLPNPVTRAQARREFLTENPDWPEEAPQILITRALYSDLKDYEDQTIAKIARNENKDPLEIVMDIMLDDRGNTKRVNIFNERGRRAGRALTSSGLDVH